MEIVDDYKLSLWASARQRAEEANELGRLVEGWSSKQDLSKQNWCFALGEGVLNASYLYAYTIGPESQKSNLHYLYHEVYPLVI